MITLILLMIFAIVLTIWLKNYDGIDTITDIVHHIPEQHHNITGNIKRQFENDQAFVIDPVDQKKTFLNSNDDMYEDANGKVWRLYS